MGFAGSFENVHEPADAIAAFPGALGAFDAQHVELAVDVAEDEISALRHKWWNTKSLLGLSD